MRQRCALLRPLGPRKRRLDLREIELENRVVDRIAGARSGPFPQALGLGVSLDQSDVIFGTSGQPQVFERLAIDREIHAGRAVFRRHVGDGGARFDWQCAHGLAEHLDKGVDQVGAPQQLGDVQHEVGRGHPARPFSGQSQPDDARRRKTRAVPEHRGLRLDAADAPAQHAEPADHGRVAIGAEQRIRARQGRPGRLFQEDHRRKPFQIELVHDAAARRDQADVRKGSRAPFEELESFPVARDLNLLVEGPRVRPPSMHCNEGMVAHEIDGNARIGLGRIAAAPCDFVAQRGHVGHQGDTGEILQQQAGRLKFESAASWTVGETGEIERPRMIRVAQRAFDQDLQRVREPARGDEALPLGAFQAHITDPALGSREGRNERRKQRVMRRSHGRSVTGPISPRPAFRILLEVAGLPGKSACCRARPKR